MVKTSPIRGDFPSLKLDRMVSYSSTIERDLLYFLEFWPHVIWYQEQPMTIEKTMLNGQVRRYTPDFEIHEGETKSIIECKPEARLESSHAQQQRKIGQKWADENDYNFVTITDTELRTGYQLTNLKLFWRYARQQHLMRQQQVTTTIGQQEMSVETLCQCLQLSAYEAVPTVCHLLFHHQLEMELSQLFTTGSLFWLKKRA